MSHNINKPDNYININIHKNAIKALIQNKSLLIQHLHCDDPQSKEILRKLLLGSVAL